MGKKRLRSNGIKFSPSEQMKGRVIQFRRFLALHLALNGRHYSKEGKPTNLDELGKFNLHKQSAQLDSFFWF